MGLFLRAYQDSYVLVSRLNTPSKLKNCFLFQKFAMKVQNEFSFSVQANENVVRYRLGRDPQQLRLPHEEAQRQHALQHRPLQPDQQKLPALRLLGQQEGRRYRRGCGQEGRLQRRRNH